MVETPSYYKMGDHTECVRITFDPLLISFCDLLAVFWRSHDPSAKVSRQYQSLLLPLTPDQQQEAQESLATAPQGARTVVRPLPTLFSPAERRHQKNQLQRQPALLQCLGKEVDLATDYVATRLNGFVAGRGNMASFNREWEGLGLSREQAGHVRKIIIRRS